MVAYTLCLEKDADAAFCNFSIHISPGSTAALGKWGGKVTHRLIACSLSNISANNYESCLM